MERDDETKCKLGILFTDEEASKIVEEFIKEVKDNGAAILTQRVKFAIQSIGTNNASKISKQVNEES